MPMYVSPAGSVLAATGRPNPRSSTVVLAPTVYASRVPLGLSGISTVLVVAS